MNQIERRVVDQHRVLLADHRTLVAGIRHVPDVEAAHRGRVDDGVADFDAVPRRIRRVRAVSVRRGEVDVPAEDPGAAGVLGLLDVGVLNLDHVPRHHGVDAVRVARDVVGAADNEPRRKNTGGPGRFVVFECPLDGDQVVADCAARCGTAGNLTPERVEHRLFFVRDRRGHALAQVDVELVPIDRRVVGRVGSVLVP